MDRLYLVVPCYNEEEVLPETVRRLTDKLRRMEEKGLVSRKVYAEVPPRVEYSITPKGKSLEHILKLMCEWGEKNIDDRFVMTNPQCSNSED